MKEERKFLRQCRVCRVYKGKEDLIRITRNYKTGLTEINEGNGVQGRSLYICKDGECIKKLLKSKKGMQNANPKIGEDLAKELGMKIKKESRS